MAISQTHQVRVRSLRFEAEGVYSVELVPVPPLEALPAFTAGSHIDLYLPNGLIRSYSLLNSQHETARYLIGVHKHPSSRGGSRHVHEAMRPGDVLTIGSPRNNFALREDGEHSVFIAGGIGITPLLSMMRRLDDLGRTWELHYAVRTRRQTAFLDLINELSRGRQNAITRFDSEPGGVRLDLDNTISAAPADSHFYCCGPLSMLDAFEAACASVESSRVHTEYFAAREKADTAGGFQVRCVKSAKTVDIRAGQTILSALLDEGIRVPYACEEGVCGTCEVKVLEGVPDHRDLVLSKVEKEEGKTMMVCCSGAKSPLLVLDL
jgi:ferredoxin-NADP reductase